MAAADHLARAAAAARHTAHDLPAARKAARDAVGVDHPGENWISRELDRFFGWIAGLLRHLEFNLSPGGAGGLRLVTWLVILALIVGAVVLIVRVLTRWRPRAGAAPRPSVRAVEETPFEQARLRALELARSDPREALRALYVALLHELGRRRGWRFQPGRSNWAFVRRLGASSDSGAALAECTRLFEGRVYGSVPAAAGDVERVAALADAVLA